MVEVTPAQWSRATVLDPSDANAEHEFKQVLGQQQKAVVSGGTVTQGDVTVETTGGFAGNIEQHGQIPGGLTVKVQGSMHGNIYVYGGNDDKPPAGAKVIDVEWNAKGKTEVALPVGSNGDININVKNVHKTGGGSEGPSGTYKPDAPSYPDRIGDAAANLEKYFRDHDWDPRDPNVYDKIQLQDVRDYMGGQWGDIVQFFKDHQVGFVDDQHQTDGKNRIAITPTDGKAFIDSQLLDDTQGPYNGMLAALRVHNMYKLGAGENAQSYKDMVTSGLDRLYDRNALFSDLPVPPTDDPNGYLNSLHDSVTRMTTDVENLFSAPSGPLYEIAAGLKGLQDKGAGDDYINWLFKSYHSKDNQVSGGKDAIQSFVDNYTSTYMDKVSKFIDKAVEGYHNSEKLRDAKERNAIISLITGLLSGPLVLAGVASDAAKSATSLIKKIEAGAILAGNVGWTFGNTYASADTLNKLLHGTPSKDGRRQFNMNGEEFSVSDKIATSYDTFMKSTNKWTATIIDSLIDDKGQTWMDEHATVLNKGRGSTPDDLKSNPTPTVDGYVFTTTWEHTVSHRGGGFHAWKHYAFTQDQWNEIFGKPN